MQISTQCYPLVCCWIFDGSVFCAKYEFTHLPPLSSCILDPLEGVESGGWSSVVDVQWYLCPHHRPIRRVEKVTIVPTLILPLRHDHQHGDTHKNKLEQTHGH